MELVGPLYGCAVRLHGSVLAFEMPYDIRDLDTAAWFERAKGAA
jgi:hypothetical protein